MAKRYEAEGGDYKDTGGKSSRLSIRGLDMIADSCMVMIDNKNKAQKGEPEKK